MFTFYDVTIPKAFLDALPLTVHTSYDVTIPKAFLDALPLTVRTFYDVTIPKAAPTLEQFNTDVKEVWQTSNSKAGNTFAHRRLKMLEWNFQGQQLFNEDRESMDARSFPLLPSTLATSLPA
jgi:hypothetical protein